MNAAKKIILLLWLVILASLGNASALTPGATENRIWQKSSAPLETRQAGPLQTAGRHQENGRAGYDVALNSLLAAKGLPWLSKLAKCKPAGVQANRIAGARAVHDFIVQAEANGMQIVGREVTFDTPFGARRMDAILLNPETSEIGGVEIKSSLGAFERFDAAAQQQFSADRWINTFGAQGVGRSKDIFIDNTVKILWPPPAP